MTTLDDTDLLPAERKLLAAVLAGETCHLIDADAEPLLIEMSTWDDPGRHIRGEFFAYLINQVMDEGIKKIEVRGAIVMGPVVIKKINVDVEIDCEFCVYNGKLVASGVTFQKDIKVASSLMPQGAVFDEAKFKGLAGFYRSVFAWVNFDSAEFSGKSLFNNVRFDEEANFRRCRFLGTSAFHGSTFLQEGCFNWAKFAGDPLDFNAVVAVSLSFVNVQFDCSLIGTLVADKFNFSEAVFLEWFNFGILCEFVDLSDIECRRGGAIQVGGIILATGAKFLNRTIISDPGAEFWESSFERWYPKLVDEGRFEPFRAARRLVSRPALILSLRRATTADLELSSIDLVYCLFEGAHGLDEMRLDSACTLPSVPAGTRFRWPVKFTNRKVLAEEREWRKRFAAWGTEEGSGSWLELWPELGLDRYHSSEISRNAPDTTTIAGIYRSLRKGQEDSSNAPGAADFYYGEMEMRRLARREWSKRRDGIGSGPRKPSLAENWLLTAYWAVSGYGLRAWRAVAAIVVVILVGATVFATVGVDRSPEVVERVSWVHPISGAVGYEELSIDQPAFTWWDGLELASRSSVLFLRSASSTTSLTGVGTVTDITLRLLVPVLFALGALAIRGRTKR